MKKKIAIFLASVLMGTSLCAMGAFADNKKYDVDKTYEITGYDKKTSSGGVFVYPNNTDKTRVIGSSEYNFRYSKVLIFDKNGVLIEAGGDLLANENGVNGSPQLTVKVPAGGFLVAFNSGAPAGLTQCYNTVMEGAMLYNATMSVIYPAYGEYNKSTNKLRIAYDNPVEPSEDAVKFMFVGNSTTYFNGIPIKFKGLCAAAGIEVVVDYCTNGSAFLHEFADASHERGKKFRNMLNAKEYDYVVLQDAAGAGYNDMEKSVNTMLSLIKQNGATPLLYMRYSNDLDPETRVASFYKHYLNYSRLSAKFGIDYSPVADAFLKCIETHPEINLFADDGGHHSWEGSYLAACTWLYSYLGVDPRGNAYTANLPAATATALQNIAYEIAKNGYPYPAGDISKTVIDGVTYDNLSLNKPYTSSGDVYSDERWTDTGDDGKPLGKFTNGYDAMGVAGDSGECGCYKGREVSITIDLGKLSKVKRICADLYGNTGWGIPSTKDGSLKVAFSADGKSFTDAVAVSDSTTQTSGNWERRDFVITFADMPEARYVRLDYAIDGNFLWASEMSVYGTSETQNEPDVSEDEVSEDEVSEAPEVSEEQESSETPEVSEENSDVSVAPEASEPADEDTDSSSETSKPAVSGEPSEEPDEKNNTGVIVACSAVAVCAVVAACALVFNKKKNK
ncbi:MAG: hypothetical protein IKC06_09255 [Clostridia bacterium]|nr:hypothetical protein [Clostridia bacterium]